MSTLTTATTVAAGAPALDGHDLRLIAAALIGIAVVVLLITLLKVNPFLSLLLGSAALAVSAGVGAADAVASFQKGVGDTFGSVGILVALGAIVGRLLVDSGGASQVVDTIVAKVPTGALPWALAGAAALIGLPMFFEIGVVLLVPIVLLVSRRSGLPVLAVGIPALAGLSVLHGLVPPHPGPLVAIAALKADLGLTLLFGILVAIPCVALAGPVFARFVAHLGPAQPLESSLAALGVGSSREKVGAAVGTASVSSGAGASGTAAMGSGGSSAQTGDDHRLGRRRPSFRATVATVLLPVVLMVGRAIAELVLDEDTRLRSVLDVIGTPVVALTAGVVVAMFVLGVAVGADRGSISDTVEASLPPMAGTLLIIAAGGGFKQTLVDAGVGKLIGEQAQGRNLSPLILGWLVAVGIRLATGSATVATITAAGIVGPLATSENLNSATISLLVLAIGSGSLFFSHVNDVGFWLIKQYFGLTVGQTLRSWSVMETIISVVGIICVLLLSLVV